MQKIQDFLNNFIQKYLSSSKQVRRIILYALLALVLLIGSFGGYYYFDRFYSNQSTVKEDKIRTAEQAARDDPTNPDKRLALAETYMIYMRWDEAIAQALEVQASFPDKVNVDAPV